METLTRQQRRKQQRDAGIDSSQFKKNEWSVKDWQRMELIETIKDDTGSGFLYKNNLYQVIVRYMIPYNMFWLSIKRLDKSEIRSWRDMQQIKNDICGEEAEGVELFPAMSRMVDMANQYHMWVLDDKKKFEFGFNERLVKQKS